MHDADGLSDAEMQRLARWLNLSETTFLLPPTHDGADYRVRIFTLERELPFAGHPTLGTCHAWLEAGGEPRGPDVIVQECAAGDVPLRRIDGRLAFAAPPLVRSGPLGDDELAQRVALLGIDADRVVDSAWIDNGPGWSGLLLRSVEDVLAVELPGREADGLNIGLVALHDAGGDVDVEVRGFFSAGGGAVLEDPVTGSLNASVAQWLLEAGHVEAPYVAAQGRQVGADGRIHVSQDDDGTIWVAGDTTTVVTGSLQA